MPNPLSNLLDIGESHCFVCRGDTLEANVHIKMVDMTVPNKVKLKHLDL